MNRRLVYLLAILFTFSLFGVPAISPGAPDAPTAPHDDKGKKKRKSKPKKKGKKNKKKKKSGKSKRSRDVDMSALPADEAAENKAIESLKGDFKIDRTRHYSIIYNTSEEDVRVFSIAIEKTYRSCMNYTIKLGFAATPPKSKLVIYYFDLFPEYNAFVQKLGMAPMTQTTPGVYYPPINQSLFYNFRNNDAFRKIREQAEKRIEQLKNRLRAGNLSASERSRIAREIRELRAKANRVDTSGGDISESIVQHEVTHQVLWNIGFHNPDNFQANPRWFAEGTAMMFETISKGKSANIGAVNKGRLREYRALLESGKLILPLRKFISDAGYFGPQTINTAYPQSWAMAHYLNRTKRKQIPKYIALINKRPADFVPTPEQEIADFEACFGKLDEKWEKRWMKWMENVR